MKVIDMNKDKLGDGKHKVGIDILGDLDCVKYLFSVDLKSFVSELQKEIPGAELVKNNEDQFNVIVKVQNKGYNSDTFRTVITIDNKLDNIYETYYVVGHYEFKNWEISVGKDGKKPEKW